jgi:uncharacterized protein YrzB (UPF0473 family)
LCGTVRSINSTAHTITVDTDDGSEGFFKDLTNTSVSLDFDKRIRADTAAAAFTKNGVRAIVFYFGDSDVRTAVALQNLGIGPFQNSSGTVVRFHRNEHVLTLERNSGDEESFQIIPKTVAETALGAVTGYELDFHDGDRVRVTAAPSNRGEEALLIRAM